MSSKREQVIELLQQSLEPLGIRTVGEKLGLTYPQAANLLTTLASRGDVRRVSRGVYTSVDSVRSDPPALPSVSPGWIPEHHEPVEYVPTQGVHTLFDLLEDPDSPASDLVVAALRELLGIVEGDEGALCTWRENRQREIESFSSKRVLWRTFGEASAQRRDGVSVSLTGVAWNPGSPIERVPWLVQFPADLGGVAPTATVQAASLMDVINAINRRWPIPRWWERVDELRA